MFPLVSRINSRLRTPGAPGSCWPRILEMVIPLLLLSLSFVCVLLYYPVGTLYPTSRHISSIPSVCHPVSNLLFQFTISTRLNPLTSQVKTPNRPLTNHLSPLLYSPPMPLCLYLFSIPFSVFRFCRSWSSTPSHYTLHQIILTLTLVGSRLCFLFFSSYYLFSVCTNLRLYLSPSHLGWAGCIM